MAKKKFLRALSFFIFPAIVFLFDLIFNNTLFMTYDLYPWADIPMHFIGGLSVGYMSILFLKFFDEENFVIIRSRFIYLLIVVFAVSLIAVLWEFYEFIMINYLGVNWSITYEDTLFDLFFGICGGVVSVGIFRKN